MSYTFFFFFFCEVCLYLIIKLQSIYINIRVSKHLHPPPPTKLDLFRFFFPKFYYYPKKKKKAKYFTSTLKKAGGGRGELGRERHRSTCSLHSWLEILQNTV